MTPSECLQLLGLTDPASPAEIKRQYRYLAQLCHPDKHAGSAHARQRFVEIATAYRTLTRALRAMDSQRIVGTCWECREFGEVTKALDGHVRCVRCALHGRQRMLPMPPIVIARCLGTITLLAATIWLLVVAISTERMLYGAGAFAAGAASLLLLAGTCLRVAYCVTPRDRLAVVSSPRDPSPQIKPAAQASRP